MILVVFGSKSDSDVYQPILDTLKEKGIEHEFRVISAHRNPDELHATIKNNNYSLIIAGAGLAAALPGVAASIFKGNVIGVPCKGNFNGIDAFLSIAQMPSGIPVLCTGANQNPANFNFLFQTYTQINITTSILNKRVTKGIDMIEQAGIPFELNKENYPGLNLNFYDLSTENPKENAINIPLKEGSTENDALMLFKKTQNHITVGLNRGDNAAIAALKLIKRCNNG